MGKLRHIFGIFNERMAVVLTHFVYVEIYSVFSSYYDHQSYQFYKSVLIVVSSTVE